jgi:mono/diheme cytochrome c family protein
MRRERWIAILLIAGAVSIGALAGCGKKAENKDADDIMTGAPTTSAPAGDTAAAGGAAGAPSLAMGEQVVQEKCVLCHGQSGKGDGPGGAALNPRPRNWTDHTYMGSRTNDQLYEVIYNGKGAMPAWGKSGQLNEVQIRSAILKVRTFDPQYKG